MAASKRMACNCESKFQDKKYGKGIRVCNPTGGNGKVKEGYRCTVCGSNK